MAFRLTASTTNRVALSSLLIAFVALSACGKDDITGPVTRETYTLVSVDGASIPYTQIDSVFRYDTTKVGGVITDIDTTFLPASSFTRVLKTGSLALKTTNAYTLTLQGTFHPPGASTGEVTIIENGKYSVSGSTYTLRATDYVYNGRPFEADPDQITVMTLSTDTLTASISNDGGSTSTYRFKKQ